MNKRRKKILNCINYLILVCVPIIFSMISIRFWEMDFTIYPDMNGGDGILICAIIKSIQQNGISGAFFNSIIGAPTGSTLIDTPFLDMASLIFIWVVSFFVKNTSVIYYLYYIVPFAFISLAMFKLLIRQNVNIVTADVFSILMSIAPYHFYRMLGHATLGNYFTVPLGIYLAFAILEGEWKDVSHIKNKTNKIRIILFSILVGLGQLYYAFFSLMIMCLALLVRVIDTKKIKENLKYSISILIVLFCFMCNMFPKIIYEIIAGKNYLAGIRYAWESEMYGLKIIQLLLPVAYSKIPKFAEINKEYSTTFPIITENSFSSLGIIASVGFIILCILLFLLIISKVEYRGKFGILSFVSLATLCLVLFCTIGGFGTIFSFFISPQLRGLNRVSIYIYCFCLFAVAFIIEQRLQKRKVIQFAVSILILCLGIFDQFNMLAVGWQESKQIDQAEYETYFHKIEDSVGANAMIYQLPYIGFPEYGVYLNIQDYTHLLGYLLTDNLRWSYGGVKGRENLAENLYFGEGKNKVFVNYIRNSGFDGVLIDTYGYNDQGNEIIDFYSNSLELEPIVSENSRYYFYKIDLDMNLIRDTLVDKEENYMFSKETQELYAIECPLKENTVYEVKMELEYDKAPSLGWVDFYGGANYDNPEQQKGLVLSDRKNTYCVLLESGDVNSSDINPVLVRVGINTETKCILKHIVITEISEVE